MRGSGLRETEFTVTNQEPTRSRVGFRPACPSETPRPHRAASIVAEPPRLTRNVVRRGDRWLAGGLPEPFAGAGATPISLEFSNRLTNVDRRRGCPRGRDFVPISGTEAAAATVYADLSKIVEGGLDGGRAVSSLLRFNRVGTLSVQTAPAAWNRACAVEDGRRRQPFGCFVVAWDVVLVRTSGAWE